MAPIKYARPRLITPDDKRYRAYVEHYLVQRKNQRAIRPPRQRDIFGQQAENALRDWLTTRLVLADTRILEYEEQQRRYANMKYRELDALVLENRDLAWVFEIKASRTAGSLRRAFRQLRETRDILRLIFPTVYTTILLVDTGIPTEQEIDALMRSEQAPTKRPESLAQVLETLPQLSRVNCLDECNTDSELVDFLCFSVQDIIDMVGAEHLALDWERDEEEDDPSTQPASTSTEPFYSTADEEDNNAADNPLAAALRQAGLTKE